MRQLERISKLDKAEEFVTAYTTGSVTKENGTVITYNQNKLFLVPEVECYEKQDGVDIKSSMIKVYSGTNSISIDNVNMIVSDENGTTSYTNGNINVYDGTSSYALSLPKEDGKLATEEFVKAYHHSALTSDFFTNLY